VMIYSSTTVLLQCIVLYRLWWLRNEIFHCRGRRDRMVVGFITTYAISAYHH
jgi:hypothetical protein